MDNNSFTFNGIAVAFHREIDPEGDALIVQFNKNDRRDVRNITQAIQAGMVVTRPDLTVYEFMIQLTRTGEGDKSTAGFWDQAEKKQGSNSFLKRIIDEGGIRFNGRILKHKDRLDFPIFSIVAFPKSETHYTTVF